MTTWKPTPEEAADVVRWLLRNEMEFKTILSLARLEQTRDRLPAWQEVRRK